MCLPAKESSHLLHYSADYKKQEYILPEVQPSLQSLYKAGEDVLWEIAQSTVKVLPLPDDHVPMRCSFPHT